MGGRIGDDSSMSDSSSPKLLRPGDPAPDFRAEAIGGEFGMEPQTVSLSDFSGKSLVLYFYPKDNTPGCTTQACALRDSWKELLNQDAKVFGVSTDSVKSHRKFIENFDLPFALLSDESKAMVNAYGVWVEKSMYGKKYMGTERSTFVISPDGVIKAVFRKVKPSEHTEMLFDELLGGA